MGEFQTGEKNGESSCSRRHQELQVKPKLKRRPLGSLRFFLLAQIFIISCVSAQDAGQGPDSVAIAAATASVEGNCGALSGSGWTEYKDEKCLKIAGIGTQSEGQLACYPETQTLTDSLLFISNQEEQEFVTQWILEQNPDKYENVSYWLGPRKKGNPIAEKNSGGGGAGTGNQPASTIEPKPGELTTTAGPAGEAEGTTAKMETSTSAAGSESTTTYASSSVPMTTATGTGTGTEATTGTGTEPSTTEESSARRRRKRETPVAPCQQVETSTGQIIERPCYHQNLVICQKPVRWTYEHWNSLQKSIINSLFLSMEAKKGADGLEKGLGELWGDEEEKTTEATEKAKRCTDDLDALREQIVELTFGIAKLKYTHGNIKSTVDDLNDKYGEIENELGGVIQELETVKAIASKKK